MMNKFLRAVLITVSVCIALLCIAGSAISYVKLINSGHQIKQSMTESSLVSEDLQLSTTDENSSLIFYSIDEYNAYLATLPQIASAAETANNEANSVNSPSLNVPNDIELSSIMVTDEGTIFTYDFEIVDNNNVINFNTSDDVILELTHTIISKQYEADFISNYRLYAQNLAECIGAGLLSYSGNKLIYTGSVYADVYNDDTNEVQRVTIGTQKVVFTPTTSNSNLGTVIYYYYPVSISDADFAEFAGLA